MKYLSKSQIIAINKHQVDVYGGTFVHPFNFLNESNLDYLIEMVEAEIFGQPLYPEVYQKAGLYMFNIICNHIFQDGNKRTGLQVALIFLEATGFQLSEKVTDDGLIQFTTAVASAQHSLEEVQKWFKEHIYSTPTVF
jgi:death on curing protein